MPTYTYECPICHHRFEHRGKMEERYGVHCPKCDIPATLIMSPISGHYYDNPKPLYHKDGMYDSDNEGDRNYRPRR